MKKLAIIIALALAAQGCAVVETVKDSGYVGQYAVTRGAMSYVDSDVEKAERVIAVIDLIEARVNGGELTTLSLVAESLNKRIDQRPMHPLDREYARALIASVQATLEARLSPEVLSDEVFLTQVLDWIRAGASFKYYETIEYYEAPAE